MAITKPKKITKKSKPKNKDLLIRNHQLGGLYSEKEIQKLRWCFGWLFGPYCFSGRSTSKSYCFQVAGHGTKTPGYGRCSRHGGCSTGPKNKRLLTLNKLTKLDKRSKLSTDIFNEKEMQLYEELQEMIKNEYEITDTIAISQIARLLVFQSFLMDKMSQGFNVSIESSSESIRKWLSEYGLTPRSKATLNIDTSGLGPYWFSQMIENIDTAEREKKQLEQEKDQQSNPNQIEEE